MPLWSFLVTSTSVSLRNVVLSQPIFFPISRCGEVPPLVVPPDTVTSGMPRRRHSMPITTPSTLVALARKSTCPLMELVHHHHRRPLRHSRHPSRHRPSRLHRPLGTCPRQRYLRSWQTPIAALLSSPRSQRQTTVSFVFLPCSPPTTSLANPLKLSLALDSMVLPWRAESFPAMLTRPSMVPTHLSHSHLITSSMLATLRAPLSRPLTRIGCM